MLKVTVNIEGQLGLIIIENVFCHFRLCKIRIKLITDQLSCVYDFIFISSNIQILQKMSG